MASGFLDILNQLHDHHVDFVIVGGVAAVDLLWSLGARPAAP